MKRGVKGSQEMEKDLWKEVREEVVFKISGALFKNGNVLFRHWETKLCCF